MQAFLLSVLAAFTFVSIVMSMLLRADIDRLLVATETRTAAITALSNDIRKVLSKLDQERKPVECEPVECSFPQTTEAALDDALTKPLPKNKGKRK